MLDRSISRWQDRKAEVMLRPARAYITIRRRQQVPVHHGPRKRLIALLCSVNTEAVGVPLAAFREIACIQRTHRPRRGEPLKRGPRDAQRQYRHLGRARCYRVLATPLL